MCHIETLLILLSISIYNSNLVFCFDPCSGNNELVTDLKSNLDCGKGFFYLPNGHPVHKCFPRCLPKYDLETTQCSDSNPCPQGYVCPPKIGEVPTYCTIDNASCFKYHTESAKGNIWKSAWWKPNCLPNGSWAPKQCKGDETTGRCFCYDARGNRIFGEAPARDSAEMTCACSREKSETTHSESSGPSTAHCDSKGNYEPLQCNNGFCKCVNPQTGKEKSKVVSEGMMMHLPCYDKKSIGEKYLRQCESEKYAKEVILQELKTHGTEHINFSPIFCDADGTYGLIRVEANMIYCIWKDDSRIEVFASPVGAETAVNCNCARDYKIHQLRGEKLPLACAPNGNYRLEQQTNGMWFCVDDDGYRKSEFFSVKPDNCIKFL